MLNDLGNNLTTIDQIVRYQTKRLGKPYGSFTAQQLGIRNIINKGNNLYNFISSGRLKLLSCEANGMNEVRLIIEKPSNQILNGFSDNTIQTHCHDKERGVPNEKFVLANIQNANYKEGMNQKQVWQMICYNQKGKSIQQWANKENLILLDKAQLINMIQKW